MMRHWFAYPWLLVLLAALPLLAALAVWATRRRRMLLVRLGSLVTLQAVLGAQRGRRRLRRLCWIVGIPLLALGAAGPQWGRDWGQTVSPGRDLVVVVDCSRSMLAEQPSRLERARTAVLDLCDAVRNRGGHRLALVTFAGQARLACPLTHDYDHFREVAEALLSEPSDPELTPPPGEPSGTRFGVALNKAVEAHDPRYAGATDILLLSDGDDPARDPDEWRLGVGVVHAAGLPVYTIGIGDPDADNPIAVGDGILKHAGKPVATRLEQEVLREIAHLTDGTYTDARTRALPLGRVYLDTIANAPVREATEDSLPLYRQRYAYFLLPAFVLLGCSLLLSDRRFSAGS